MQTGAAQRQNIRAGGVECCAIGIKCFRAYNSSLTALEEVKYRSIRKEINLYALFYCRPGKLPTTANCTAFGNI